MRRPLVAGNWKMYGTRQSVDELLVGLNEQQWPDEVDLLIAPPALYVQHQVSASFTGSKEKKLLVPWVADAVLKVDSQHRMLILYAHFLNGLMEKDPLE